MPESENDEGPPATTATSATPRTVQGLLDLVVASANGEPWEPALSIYDFVPGMGVGASEQAIRWAWVGRLIEMERAIEKSLKRPAHRPRKQSYEKKDAWRAYLAWNMCWNVRRALGAPDGKISNRELIRCIRDVENKLQIPNDKRAFTSTDATCEQSLSRGKKLLEIDNNWNSEVCEKVSATFNQTT